MKKTLLIVALVLAITTSIIAGTMAYYTITLDELVKGEVVAKEFILEGENTSTHEAKVKIAPGESQKWTFDIKNHKDGAVTETDMDVTIDVTTPNTNAPLTIKVELDGSEITSGMKIDQLFEANIDATKTFTVTVEWPWETKDVNDTVFAGKDLGTLSVSVTGTQSGTTTATTP